MKIVLIFIASLPFVACGQTEFNTVIQSPDKEYFIAYNETETGTDKIRFYKSDSSFIKSQDINFILSASWSTDGQHVVVHGQFSNHILVFKKTGEKIFSGDYQDLTKDNSKVLYNVIVSESVDEILINSGDDVTQVNTANKAISFTVQVGRVASGSFFSSKNKIVLKIHGSQKGKFDLITLSKSNGAVLSKDEGVTKVAFKNSSYIFFDGRQYFEIQL